jgi:hypothetical protein
MRSTESEITGFISRPLPQILPCILRPSQTWEKLWRTYEVMASSCFLQPTHTKSIWTWSWKQHLGLTGEIFLIWSALTVTSRISFAMKSNSFTQLTLTFPILRAKRSEILLCCIQEKNTWKVMHSWSTNFLVSNLKNPTSVSLILEITIGPMSMLVPTSHMEINNRSGML